MTDNLLFALMEKRLSLLKQFLRALVEERDAIISFSLEGIIRANNVKEELLKKLEFLEDEQKKLSTEEMLATALLLPQSASLKAELQSTLKEVKAGLEKNMKLLTFSMDHVKNSIERMISFINKASYGRKKESMSVMISRSV